ncbi:caspase family protein [Brevundimonas sp.]|uniref:caspase family protein n=1 Tax=Brevundimonas sp. TaxID=1871086 RepID=UPI0028978CA7|nr:caspase family protein [Brevundimonas sp.]
MKFEQGRALIVGVADYADVGSLPAAVLNDTRDIADLLRSSSCGYPAENITVLTDREATLAGIRKALANLAASAQPKDTVVIFFSGHGVVLDTGPDPTSALVPQDARLSDLVGTTLGEAELSRAISNIKASRVLLIIDACHAGGAASLKSIVNEEFVEGFAEKSLSQLGRGVGRAVFASSRASETSLILTGATNSVFTTAVLSGLKGAVPGSGDGTVKVFDLFNHVAEAVRQAVPGRQHPIFKASQLEENFPVALARGGVKSTEHTEQAVRDRGLETIFVDLFPMGPLDQDLWLRAGGDVSRLTLSGNGRSQWFGALRLLSRGGGGGEITQRSLVEAALEEFPRHRDLQALL